jgi:hypothetical protein
MWQEAADLVVYGTGLVDLVVMNVFKEENVARLDDLEG